jgi:hypothetical protein
MTIIAEKNITYITDRRVVRFAASNPWFVTTRTIGWDEVVKVKTHVSSWWMRMLNVGTVVIHARSTVAPLLAGEDLSREVRATDDDVHIEDVEYYRDLGNYLDKLLYLYKREPNKLDTLREFIPKPRGKRY